MAVGWLETGWWRRRWRRCERVRSELGGASIGHFFDWGRAPTYRFRKDVFLPPFLPSRRQVVHFLRDLVLQGEATLAAMFPVAIVARRHIGLGF